MESSLERTETTPILALHYWFRTFEVRKNLEDSYNEAFSKLPTHSKILKEEYDVSELQSIGSTFHATKGDVILFAH